MAERDEAGDRAGSGRKRPPARSERLLELAEGRYEMRRNQSWPYLLRGERKYTFSGQDRRDVGADLRAAWRSEYPGDGVPSRADIAQVLDDLHMHAELKELDPVTAAEEVDSILAASSVAECLDTGDAYYVDDGGCMWWRKPAQGGGFAPVMLATFTAEIAEEVTLDDGAERTLTWLIRVTARDGRSGDVRITPDQLGRPQLWAAKAAGTSALVMPGLAVADHLRVAVQSTSSPVRRTAYTHTGWREIGGRHVFLTASGALGADGLDESVTVDLGTLSGYALPAPTAPTVHRDAIRSSLALLSLAPDSVIVPVLAAVYRAPLPIPPDCTVWPYGRSGTYKTAVTALGQQHYGATLDAYNLPGNWTSTGNFLVQQAHALKDVLFTVDDYSPDITKVDAQRRAAAADQLMRGAANRAGRGRLRPDGSRRPDKPPRAQLLASAEDLPPAIESLLARSVLTEVKPGAVEISRLTEAQAIATDGNYALAMTGYIQHLARRHDDGDLPGLLAAERTRLRDEARAAGQHPRTALNVASLGLGWREFLTYAVQSKAITWEEHDRVWLRSWKALCEVGAEQERYRHDADPVGVYLSSLRALIAAGRAHLAALDGGRPGENPIRWGWAEVMSAGEPCMRSQGDLIGWTDGESVHLEADVAYRAARQFAETSGGQLNIAKRVLHGHLHDRGLLASADPGHHTARHDLGGKRDRRNLHLTVRAFDSGARP